MFFSKKMDGRLGAPPKKKGNESFTEGNNWDPN